MSALSELSTTYIETYRALHRHAQRIVGNAEAADDVVQQAFLNTADSIKAGTEIEYVGPYLRRCIYNLAIRRVQRAAVVPLEDDLTDSGDDLPDEVAHVKRRWQEVYEVVSNLTPAQRSAFLLAELRGYKYCEIADALDRSEPSVRQLLSRARARIRKKAGVDSVPLVLPVLVLRWPRLQPASIVDQAGSVVKSVVEFLVAQFHKVQAALLGQVEQVVHGLGPAAVVPLAVVVFATSAGIDGSNGTIDGALGDVARLNGQAPVASSTPGNTSTANNPSADRQGDTGVAAPPSAVRGHSPRPAVERGNVELPPTGGSGSGVTRANPIGEKAGLAEGPADVISAPAPVTAPLVDTGTISSGDGGGFWAGDGLYCWADLSTGVCTDGQGSYFWWNDQGNQGLWSEGEGVTCLWSQAELQGFCSTPDGQAWPWDPNPPEDEESESGKAGNTGNNSSASSSAGDRGDVGDIQLGAGNAEEVSAGGPSEPGDPSGGPNSSADEAANAGNQSSGSNDAAANTGEMPDSSAGGQNGPGTGDGHAGGEVGDLAHEEGNLADEGDSSGDGDGTGDGDGHFADEESGLADEGDSTGDEGTSDAGEGDDAVAEAEGSADEGTSDTDEGDDPADEVEA